MTFAVIEQGSPFLADMIARACESAGHDCLVFKDIAQVTRVLHAIRVDTLVVDIQRSGLNGLDWLETMAPSWPDLPSRTLLLTNSELTRDEVTRIRKLGADVVARPFSLVDVEIVVMDRLQKTRSDLTGEPTRDSIQATNTESPAGRSQKISGTIAFRSGG